MLREWSPPPIDGPTRRRLLLGALRAAGLMRPPRPPAVELRPRGKRHSLARDARAVRHHYDVANEFFALFLDESMTYSCAIFEDPSRDDEPLESAQERKLETICRKLALTPGERVLDVGCGWGSFAMHAATRHGAHVVGITLSQPQARLARERAAAAGVADRVEIRVADYREMARRALRRDREHRDGRARRRRRSSTPTPRRWRACWRPAGGCSTTASRALRADEAEAGAFSERYVFPDAAPMQLSRVQRALERAGFVTEHVEGYAAHYARTLAHWAARLDANAAEGERLAGAGADARVAAVPARRAQRLSDRLHVDLPGALPPGVSGGGVSRRAGRARPWTIATWRCPPASGRRQGPSPTSSSPRSSSSAARQRASSSGCGGER